MPKRGLGRIPSWTRFVRPALCRVLERSPQTDAAEDVRRFQLHQHENCVGPATIQHEFRNCW